MFLLDCCCPEVKFGFIMRLKASELEHIFLLKTAMAVVTRGKNGY